MRHMPPGGRPAMFSGRIAPDVVFDGKGLREGAALEVENGLVVQVCAARSGDRRVSGYVAAGYVDLQVNGGGGVLLNADPTPQGIMAIAAAHRQLGTVAILPTLITDGPEVMDRAVAALLEVWGVPGIVGIHLEGPHITVAKRGTHAERFIRPLDEATFANVSRLRAAEVPVMLTLAPEACSAQDITTLVEMGVIVSLGHTGASTAKVHVAFDAGASCVTHLFNAMSQMQGRDAGLVGTAINSTAHVGIICDGHHVADDMIALACRARPQRGRMFLVSDAMPSVGGPEVFRLYDSDIRVTDGKLVNVEGALAGAHTAMADGVQRLVAKVGLTPQDALSMAITVPARLIGRDDLAQLRGRRISDLLCLNGDLAIRSTLAEALAP